MLSVLFALFAGAAHANVMATGPNCLDAARVQKIDSEFKIEISKDAQGKPAIPTLDPCDEEGLGYKFYQALIFIQDLPALSIRPDAFDQNIMTDLPYVFFTDHIQTIVFDVQTSRGCSDGNTAAYVQLGQGKVMHICPDSGGADILYLADTLIHEARHVDGYSHTLCSHGRWAGVMFYGCDPNYQYLGSYAIETELNIRLARTPAIASETRESARGYAVMTFLENFDEGPFGIRKGLITQQTDGKIGFFDGIANEPLFNLEHPADLVVMRANLATVYGYADGSVKSYLNRTLKVETGGIYATTFRAFTPDARRDMLDVLYLKTASCFLTAKHLRCDDGADKTSELDLQTIRPKSLLAIADYLAILDVDGYVYTIDPASIGSAKFVESNFVRGAAPLDVVSLVTWENKAKIGIDKSGAIRRYNVSGQAGAAIPELAGAQYTKLLGPTWWSAHLADF